MSHNAQVVDYINHPVFVTIMTSANSCGGIIHKIFTVLTEK